jgi:hypothetical protein
MSGTVRIDGDNLVLELHLVDKILSFHRSLTIPLKHVLSVSTERVGWTQYPGARVGTGLPGVIRDGTYLTAEGAMFFEMHNPDECLTISLNDEHYKKIIFGVKDKESVAMMINDAISRTE